MTEQVVIVGGGITGAGVLWDLALRGIPALLIEQGDLAHGTSGRFHGLLHSGARYAVSDPETAAECAQENAILQQVAGAFIEPCGGYFVQLPQDDDDFLKRWLAGCQSTGIVAEEVDVTALRGREPLIHPQTRRAFRVADAAIDSFGLIRALVQHAVKLGARVMTETRLNAVEVRGGRVIGVRVLHRGQERSFPCDLLVSAAGPWASQVAAMAGIELPIIPLQGTHLVLANRPSHSVLNRLHAPGDGDILVPHGRVGLFGTTSQPATDIERPWCTEAETKQLLALGAEFLPGIERFRVLRAFAGVRPIYDPKGIQGVHDGRALSRSFDVLDHTARDGLDGFLSVVGGKLTTFRLMAERTADEVAKRLGIAAGSRTRCVALQPVSLTPAATPSKVADSIVLCECEQVTRAELRSWIASGAVDIHALRTRTWSGMGPCQGAFCALRLAALLYQEGRLSPEAAQAQLIGLLQERARGQTVVGWGQNARQVALNHALYEEGLGLKVFP